MEQKEVTGGDVKAVESYNEPRQNTVEQTDCRDKKPSHLFTSVRSEQFRNLKKMVYYNKS